MCLSILHTFPTIVSRHYQTVASVLVHSCATPILRLTCLFAKSFLSWLRPCLQELRGKFAIRRRLGAISYREHAASTFRMSPSPAISVNLAAVVLRATVIIATWQF